jgi:hypothetical protein
MTSSLKVGVAPGFDGDESSLIHICNNLETASAHSHKNGEHQSQSLVRELRTQNLAFRGLNELHIPLVIDLYGVTHGYELKITNTSAMPTKFYKSDRAKLEYRYIPFPCSRTLVQTNLDNSMSTPNSESPYY